MPRVGRLGEYWRGSFDAMAGPCELLCSGVSRRTAARATELAVEEARRIEAKFSRYRSDNLVHALNHGDGRPVRVDPETARLIDFADHCHKLTEGAFDITSAVLGKVWSFDGSDRVPSEDSIAELLQHVGWDRVTWDPPELTLPAGTQIDFGGIGKEYAVDRVAHLLASELGGSYLVSFGGDMRATGRQRGGLPWTVGIEKPGANERAVRTIALASGGIATSGDARRFLLKDGVRYGHILDPRTGWPVRGAPRSVTVQADTCIEAGLLATVAMLQGPEAETFLKLQGVRHWILRDSHRPNRGAPWPIPGGKSSPASGVVVGARPRAKIAETDHPL